MENLQEKLYYTSKGEGKCVLLVHGFCENNTIWEDFVPILAQKYRVIVPDLGGFGNSAELLPEDVQIDDLALQLKSLLDSLNIKKCIYIGHSLGGYVGLSLAEHFPEYLEGLCLFNSTALADSEAKKRSRNHTTFFVQKNGVKPFAEDFSAMMFFAGRREELHQKIEYIKESVRNTPENSILQCTIALRDRPDRTHILPKLKFPMMYIIGRDDASIPFDTYEKQILMPKNCTIHILENTGHVAMLERPKETQKMVWDFVEAILKD